jgi:large subunit ribosomal protein L4
MPTTTIRNKDGGSGSIALSEKVFGAKANMGLMHQAVLTENTNRRQGTQDTKTRADVAHTTKKPYKQKGTGRARQGMTSAPQYRHGGIALGPHPRTFHISLPKKMRRAAIKGALSSKFETGSIVVVDVVSFDTISTKAAASYIASLELTGQRILVVIADENETATKIYKSFRNIPGVEVRVAPAFSTRDILVAQTIVMTQGAIEKIESVWGVNPVPAKEPDNE